MCLTFYNVSLTEWLIMKNGIQELTSSFVAKQVLPLFNEKGYMGFMVFTDFLQTTKFYVLILYMQKLFSFLSKVNHESFP